MTIFDAYGEEYGDWEDPSEHVNCTGCPVCFFWQDKPDHVIRSERRTLVSRWRTADGTDLTPREAAQQDRKYWEDRGSAA